jgi:hypothetical protein
MHKEDQLFDLFGIVDVVLDLFGRSRAMLRKQFVSVCCAFLVIAMAGTAWAAPFTVDGSQEIGGIAPELVGIGPITIVATGGPWGTSSDWTYDLSGYDAVDLDGSTLTYTRHGGAVPDVYYGRGTITFDLGTAALTGDTGVLGTEPVRYLSGTSTNARRYTACDHISIQTAGDIDIGGIDASTASYYGNGGKITIGAVGARAGTVQIGYLHSNGGATSRVVR